MDIVTKSQLNILIQLAQVDKHFSKEEREMILGIARSNSFPEETVHSLIQNPQPISSLGALSTSKKFEYLISCIHLIFADKKVFDSEIRFCQNIAIKLGFNKNVVGFLVQNHEKGIESLKSRVFAEYA